MFKKLKEQKPFFKHHIYSLSPNVFGFSYYTRRVTTHKVVCFPNTHIKTRMLHTTLTRVCGFSSPPGIVWQHENTLVMQVMLWATANVTTMMDVPSARLTEIMTVMQLETVVSTMVQAGGLTPAWQLTWMGGITVGATVGWPMVSTGGRGISWQMDGLENATPSRGWRWRQDPGTFLGHPR